MVRNLDHRVEITCPIFDPDIRKVLKNMLEIQLDDNVKARILDNHLQNQYVRNKGKKVRSQVEQYNYLQSKRTRQQAADSLPELSARETIET
jgi:polyphosphate kinase